MITSDLISTRHLVTPFSPQTIGFPILSPQTSTTGLVDEDRALRLRGALLGGLAVAPAAGRSGVTLWWLAQLLLSWRRPQLDGCPIARGSRRERDVNRLCPRDSGAWRAGLRLGSLCPLGGVGYYGVQVALTLLHTGLSLAGTQSGEIGWPLQAPMIAGTYDRTSPIHVRSVCLALTRAVLHPYTCGPYA